MHLTGSVRERERERPRPCDVSHLCIICASLALVALLYVAFMEVCRAAILTNTDRHFESVASTVRYHWLRGGAQEDIERFHGETYLAAVRLLEGLNLTYIVKGGMALVIGEAAASGIEPARMMPWDDDGDIVVFPEARDTLLKAVQDGVVAKILDLSVFELDLKLSDSSIKIVAGILYHKLSGRRVELKKLYVYGKWAPHIDNCAMTMIELHTEPMNRCSDLKPPDVSISSPQDCKAACAAKAGCEYWSWIAPDCFQCKRIMWEGRAPGETTWAGGPAHCSFDQTNGSLRDPLEGIIAATYFSVVNENCKHCATYPEWVSEEERRGRKRYAVPVDWVLPTKPCPVQFWFPGAAEAFSLQCPADLDRLLRYEYGDNWRSPPKSKRFCGIRKSDASPWEAVLLAGPLLAVLGLATHASRRCKAKNSDLKES